EPDVDGGGVVCPVVVGGGGEGVVVVVVGWVSVVVVCVAVLWVCVGVVGVVWVEVVLPQLVRTRSSAVCRLSASVVRSWASTVRGSSAAVAWAFTTDACACRHCWASTSEEAWSRFELMASAALWGISPLRSPQATRNALPKPSAAASRRIESQRIGRRMLLAVFQPLGEGLGQPRGPDGGGGAGDVVGRAPVGRRPGAGVQHQPGRAGVAVARLAHAAGVDQPLAILQPQLGVGRAHLAGRALALLAAERHGHVRVADQAHP